GERDSSAAGLWHGARGCQTWRSRWGKQCSRKIGISRSIELVAGNAASRFIFCVLERVYAVCVVSFKIAGQVGVPVENSEIKSVARKLDRPHDNGDDARCQQHSFDRRRHFASQRAVLAAKSFVRF